ncbi:YgjP-like metallopeptidase domain-containing protein [Salinithrix halophila]|uniref:YgjP-like metallopeptidase domain-containing protein n=1 Tax=Salinithrix halophila TaxID=1485204 RepID=A0ABV8JHG7_9BACL
MGKDRGYFELRRDQASSGREHFIHWYRVHAQPWLTRKVDLWKCRLGVHPTEIPVMDLGYRWGSCGLFGKL